MTIPRLFILLCIVTFQEKKLANGNYEEKETMISSIPLFYLSVFQLYKPPLE